MASKLELTFTGAGVVDQTLTVFSGAIYTFKTKRNGFREVTVGASASEAGMNFYQAFKVDDNYLDEFTLTLTEEQQTTTDEFGNEVPGEIYSVVTIEHEDNTKFDGFVNSTTFITANLTSTTQEPTPSLSTALSAATDPCGNYKLTITTNQSGTVTVESPVGIQVYSGSSDGVNPVVVELARLSTAQTSVVKINGLESLYTAPPVLSISSIDIEGSPFGATATINTSSGLNRTYSLDNVSFQGSNTFSGLLAGNYTGYVKDDFGCTKSKTFTVTQEQTQGLTAPPFIRVPVHNSIRFTQRNGNTFLNYLSTENPGFVSIRQHYQHYLTTDTLRTQFKSSYANNKVFRIDESGAETEISVIKKSNNINRTNIYEGNYTDKEGRLAVYFTSGNIYNEDGTVKNEGHLLNGRLPTWYENGLYLNIEGIGATQIDKIILHDDGTTYAITQMDSVGTVTNKKITSIHTAHPYEVYEFETSFPTEGKYQLRLEYWNDTKEFYLSEILKVQSELEPEFLEVQWWNESNNDILYNTGIRHLRRLKWENYFTLKPKTEKETYDTDKSVELINSKSFAVYVLNFEAMPMELARGLQVAFDNSSTIVINGVKFVSENPVKLEPAGQWYDFEAELTLVDQTMDGQQEVVDVISAEFLVVDTTDNDSPGFLRL